MSGETISDILKNILRKNRKEVLDNLEDTSVVSEVLYQKGVLGKRQYQAVKSKAIQLDAAALILDSVEQTGLRGFFTFCYSLSEEYSWLKDQLLSAAMERGITVDILEPVETDLTSGIYRNAEDYMSILPEEVLDSLPSEKHLLHISKSLCEDDWEILALELGLSTAETDHAKNTSTNAVFQIHSMLVTWKRKKANEATFRALARGLGHCDLEHILHQVSEFVSDKK